MVAKTQEQLKWSRPSSRSGKVEGSTLGNSLKDEAEVLTQQRHADERRRQGEADLLRDVAACALTYCPRPVHSVAQSGLSGQSPVKEYVEGIKSTALTNCEVQSVKDWKMPEEWHLRDRLEKSTAHVRLGGGDLLVSQQMSPSWYQVGNPRSASGPHH